jgi:hypothetical protein
MLLVFFARAAQAQVSVTQPADQSTVGWGNIQLCASWQSPVSWVDFYLDDANGYLASAPPGNCTTWNSTNYYDWHWLFAVGFDGNGNTWTAYSRVDIVPGRGSGSSGGGGGSFAYGNQISALTGHTTLNTDTNDADYGNYYVQGDGYGLIGGPLITDDQAAAHVVATQQSCVENGSCDNGQFATVNADANNGFNWWASNNPSDYVNQLNAWKSAYKGNPWYPIIQRVDGACPMANPTTAEVLQWAANKWGINPLLAYAVASYESSLNQAAINTHGGSGNEDAGLFQISDRGANHAYPGFDGYGANLARENTCFNADFWGAYIYGAYHGILGSPGGDIGAAIESYGDGYATSAGPYTQGVYSYLTQQIWVSWFYNGVPVPY